MNTTTAAVFVGIEAKYHSTIEYGAESWLVYKGTTLDDCHRKGIVFFTFRSDRPEDVSCRSSLKAIRSFIGFI